MARWASLSEGSTPDHCSFPVIKNIKYGSNAMQTGMFSEGFIFNKRHFLVITGSESNICTYNSKHFIKGEIFL